MSVFVAILGLAFLILVHEAGHFFVARWVGMRPRKFYIGFGKPIANATRNGVEYGIGSLDNRRPTCGNAAAAASSAAANPASAKAERRSGKRRRGFTGIGRTARSRKPARNFSRRAGGAAGVSS